MNTSIITFGSRPKRVPAISASAAYRLESTARGAEGFLEFANPELNREQRSPIYVYDRLDEPSRGMLEENLAAAHGGESCVTFATGMAAISAALGVLLKAGDTVIAHRTVYGCTWSLLANWYPRLGLRAVFADLTDLGELEQPAAVFVLEQLAVELLGRELGERTLHFLPALGRRASGRWQADVARRAELGFEAHRDGAKRRSA